ncbi:family 16 glycosylhydrolase [Vibrio sp. WXL210]|uniref:family 16 glycosylhydrolase n=1 Tax=Vibrio sp. WXL210 TaxID=3450709 RepID=UPI003EC4FA7A
MRKVVCLAVGAAACLLQITPVLAESIDLSQWQLTWNDEFDYPDSQLEENWISQNGPTENPYVLSSRWRENAEVKDGVLHLHARKESRGGQDWTTGNVWTKRTFGYGYFEARMKYAAATGTNNSFWFWPTNGVPEGQKACEVDVNEGHYPNIINTNVHNWTDKWTNAHGRTVHHDNQLHHTPFGQPDHNIVFDKAFTTSKLRLRSNNPASLHISDFRVLAPSQSGYPDVMTAAADSGPTNHSLAKDVKIRTNGINIREGWPSKEEYAIDGNPKTRWVSKKDGAKFLELTWDEPKQIGAVQLINGWLQEFGAEEGGYHNLMSDYAIEYYDGKKWVSVADYSATQDVNFGEEWHTYGLQWDQDYFRFYLNGELFYEMRNDVCFSETTMLLSLALLKYNIAGPVTDEVDGTSMKIDYVRYYTPKQ